MVKFCGRGIGILSASDVWELSDKSSSESTALIENAALLRELPLSVWTLKTAGYYLVFSLTFGQLTFVTHYRTCLCRHYLVNVCLQHLCEFVIVLLTVL